ncbi:uncharacterized protein LOC128887944 [Hylaeus anthracinus]|uniref:uncharacterized protein LOC128887944 n=1 Tax=Hylaeus anthracinus TaxID=313031 RepID=UPI0023B97F61|nr:uncharacterized protein LOC128887944 [Hylaeus anthracinus]
MNFIVVPFLLAIRLPTNGDRWHNGPEYTFNVTVSTISDLATREDSLAGSSLITSLKCRPREPYRLHCRYENTKLTKLAPKGINIESAIPPEDAVYEDFCFGNTSFEIKFDDEGIDHYRFENDEVRIPPYRRNLYRIVANQLNIGSKFGEIEEIKKLDNTTVGECTVDYKVTKSKLDKQSADAEFLFTWPINMRIETALKIEKEVRLDECIPHPVYFFGPRADDVVPTGSIEKLISSHSKVFITDTEFTSESVNNVKVYDTNRKIVGFVLDYVRLTFAAVDPATSDFKEISDTITAGPIVNKLRDMCL